MIEMLHWTTRSTVKVNRPLLNSYTLASLQASLLYYAGYNSKVCDYFEAVLSAISALFTLYTCCCISRNTHWDCVGASVFRATVGPNVETAKAEEELRHSTLCVSGQQ